MVTRYDNLFNVKHNIYQDIQLIKRISFLQRYIHTLCILSHVIYVYL